ncbi:MAG: polysaccharide deacetylase family protein [Chitinophagaceae bacterium]|nr:polysaccharide deacetylase family protein [Chitinophagaceae bacterium]
MKFITTYKDYALKPTLLQQLRGELRKSAIRGLSLFNTIEKTNNWIRLPYYHHVFDDEKKGFERQLKYLKNFGEFISMDDVCTMILSEHQVDGRYFCVSFDDGYRCCYSNMMDVTVALGVPVIIYLPTDYIGLSENNPADVLKIKQNYPENPHLELFLSWNHCREMIKHNVSFGSHTCSHVNLIKLNEAEIGDELKRSKEIIETELQQPCVHFACPWGQININFNPAITKPLAEGMGYKSFATTHRGKMVSGSDLFQLKRDHLLAEWGNYQLKYFFSK